MSVVDQLVSAAELVIGMTWETWWALVLGFTLSGAVEAFVSEERMTDLLGDDGWREATLGTAFGAASSSCSYSAVGTARTLFKKGASGVAALAAFMFASTDLVFELGLVMWVLLGWQFVLGEYVGGLVAVVVMVAIFRYVVPQSWFDHARERVRENDDEECAACGMDADGDEAVYADAFPDAVFCCEGCLTAYENRTDAAGETSLRERVFSVAGWKSAASATTKDWEMLWDDIAIGFLIAGVVGAFVPTTWWTALFGADGSLEAVAVNVVIGVVIGILTFMCSVGNVPFALVLWTNGLPFGGILAFIYGDLLIPPLVNLYRKYYGWRLAAALSLSLFVSAVVAGVVVHTLFDGLGLIPTQGTVGGTLSGEYTTVLNLALTPVFLAQVYVTFGRDGVERRLAAGAAKLLRLAEWVVGTVAVLGTATGVVAGVVDAFGDVLHDAGDRARESVRHARVRALRRVRGREMPSPGTADATAEQTESDE
ncbi:permease [Haloprofundus marisrubri]|uniref:permease n=1 Tax=Haloprofundus marisrubri TaxID=1514971 RepID=UPI0008F89955|nr:permease [Haloprofundus marisrubri]